MIFKKLILNTIVASALFSYGVQAEKSPEAAVADKTAITAILDKFQLKVESVAPSPLAGLFEVVTNGGVVYSTKDGSYFIYGQLFHNSATESVNLTEQALAKRNKAIFEKANIEKELIVYPAKNEKYVVNVFTDTTCGYCMKLHNEMAQYNDLGITVRYVAFPRSGKHSENIKQMSAIWCSDDKLKAMNLAKTNKFNQESDKCVDLIHRHMDLGSSMGINGTPAILLQNGQLLSGYVPANKLIEILKNNK